MELIHTPHRIYAEDPAGNCIAEITFPAVRPGVWNIDHTFVGPSLRAPKQRAPNSRQPVPMPRHGLPGTRNTSPYL